MNLLKQPFGRMPDGRNVELYILTNDRCVKVSIMTYGGIVVSIETPDSLGRSADITLGYDNLDGYLKDNSPYLGAIIGRYANRIGRGKFTLNGVAYKLALNNGPHHLHGGRKGFDKVVWQAAPVRSDLAVGVKLSYLSSDGQEGYPGNLHCTITYSLNNDNEFKIEYRAETDKPTPINLTNHAYFNLAGEAAGDILNHELTINAAHYTVVDDTLIPTGQIKPVKGSALDFTQPTAIGARIGRLDNGYDNNYVLNSTDGSLALAAAVFEPTMGRTLEVFTTEPGLQFYTGNFLDGSIKGKSGAAYRKHSGFCLETQHFPDSPNQSGFPSAILHPGRCYSQNTVYKFTPR